MQLKRKICAAAAALLVLIGSSSAWAGEKGYIIGDPTLDVIVDFAAIRPAAIAVTALGCAFFVATLPFTVWTKERISQAGDKLVLVPGKFAFVRPLGEIERSD